MKAFIFNEKSEMLIINGSKGSVAFSPFCTDDKIDVLYALNPSDTADIITLGESQAVVNVAGLAQLLNMIK